jgi:hypothetical protein
MRILRLKDISSHSIVTMNRVLEGKMKKMTMIATVMKHRQTMMCALEMLIGQICQPMKSEDQVV